MRTIGQSRPASEGRSTDGLRKGKNTRVSLELEGIPVDYSTDPSCYGPRETERFKGVERTNDLTSTTSVGVF